MKWHMEVQKIVSHMQSASSLQVLRSTPSEVSGQAPTEIFISLLVSG